MPRPIRPRRRPATVPADVDLAAQLAAITGLAPDDLRALWRRTFRQEPPAGLTRDLLARMITYRIQERALGGLDPGHAKLLDRSARSGGEPPRRLKTGTLLVREYQGVLHEVVVVPGGFQWRGTAYVSLSAIAKDITGTAWNGPRFFGLRAKAARQQGDDAGSTRSHGDPEVPRRGRHPGGSSSSARMPADVTSSPTGLSGTGDVR